MPLSILDSLSDQYIKVIIFTIFTEFIRNDQFCELIMIYHIIMHTCHFLHKYLLRNNVKCLTLTFERHKHNNNVYKINNIHRIV